MLICIQDLVQPAELYIYLGSLVGKSIAWKAYGRGLKSHPRQAILLNVTSEMCCFAFLLCCLAEVFFHVHVHEHIKQSN